MWAKLGFRAALIIVLYLTQIQLVCMPFILREIVRKHSQKYFRALNFVWKLLILKYNFKIMVLALDFCACSLGILTCIISEFNSAYDADGHHYVDEC